jgi:integrase
VKRRRTPATLIDADAHRRVLAAAPPWLREYVDALYATGARPGELAGVTAANVTGDVVTVWEHKTAARGHSRTVYLPPATAAAFRLLAAARPVGPLFRGRYGGGLSRNAVVHAFAAIRRRTGLCVTAYDYRHTFATRLLAAGIPDAVVAELLGHRGTDTLHRHYAHLSARSDVLRAAIASL